MTNAHSPQSRGPGALRVRLRAAALAGLAVAIGWVGAAASAEGLRRGAKPQGDRFGPAFRMLETRLAHRPTPREGALPRWSGSYRGPWLEAARAAAEAWGGVGGGLACSLGAVSCWIWARRLGKTR